MLRLVTGILLFVISKYKNLKNDDEIYEIVLIIDKSTKYNENFLSVFFFIYFIKIFFLIRINE